MLNRTALFTAACLSAAAGLFVTSLNAADNVTVTNATITYSTDGKDPEMALPSGITVKDLNADKSIDKILKKTTEDAITKNGFDNLVSLLADQDRDRVKTSAGKDGLGNIDGTKNQRLNDLTDRINNVWKTKYNQKFDLDTTKVFVPTFVHIQTGEVNDPNLLVDNWPVDAAINASTLGKMTPDDARIAREKMFGGRVNLEKGRDVAIVHILAEKRMPGLTASLIRETASGWKYDVPNSLSAKSFYDNLVANLEQLDEKSSMWPADSIEAYRQVNHAVIAAMYDINWSKTGNASANGLDAGSVRPSNTVDNR